MATLKYKDPTTGNWEQLSTAVGDTLPIGSIVDYDGTTVPTNWEEIPDEAIKVTTVGTDLNDYKDEGTYFFNASVAPTNIPSGSNGWLQVFKGSSLDNSATYVKQTWYRLGSMNSNDFQKYQRTYTSSSDTWSNWSVLNNSIYSTSEYRVGTWIDGKPIYRKVAVGTTNNASYGEINTKIGITNVDTIISYSANIKGWILSYLTRLINLSGTLRLDILNQSNDSEYNAQPYKCIVEYTKITE